MTLIEHEARVGLPRMWEHPKRTRTRRGGVVTSMVGGYTAILLVRQPNGVENSIRRQCATLNEAEKWLDEQMGEDEWATIGRRMRPACGRPHMADTA